MATDKTPRQNRIREALGRIYDQEPQHFREYLERFREDPKSRVFAPLAEAYRRMGRLDEAIEVCKEGLTHHPGFPGGRVALSKCYIDQKDYENARRELEVAVQYSPENLLAQRLLGDMCLVLDDVESAIHSYKMALLLSPADVALSEKVHGLEKKLNAPAPKVNVSSPSTPESEGLETPDELVSMVDLSEDETVQFTAKPLLPERELEEAKEILARSQHGLNYSGEPLTSLRDEPVAEKAIEYVAEEEEDDDDDFVVGLSPVDSSDEEVAADPDIGARVNALLGFEEGDDSFQAEPLSRAFQGQEEQAHSEITTATLADLYLAQGQHQQALEIFQRLYKETKNPALKYKVEACQLKLGVDHDSIARTKKIEILRGILRKNHSAP